MTSDPYKKFKRFRMSAHHPLRDFMEAPDAYGFYEIGIAQGAIFVPKYGGRSVGTTLANAQRSTLITVTMTTSPKLKGLCISDTTRQALTPRHDTSKLSTS